MDRTEEQLKELALWRQKKNLSAPHEQVKQSTEDEEKSQTVHFFNYNPDLGPTDLSKVSLKHDETKDKAIFSIPLSFTKKTKTVYKQHDKTQFGFDVRAYLTPNNSPMYPIRK